MFRAIEKVGRRMFQAPTIPSMMTGATDMAQLRAKGVQAYGVGEPVAAADGPLGGAHSDDEHISVHALMTLIQFLWNIVMEVGLVGSFGRVPRPTHPTPYSTDRLTNVGN